MINRVMNQNENRWWLENFQLFFCQPDSAVKTALPMQSGGAIGVFAEDCAFSKHPGFHWIDLDDSVDATKHRLARYSNMGNPWESCFFPIGCHISWVVDPPAEDSSHHQRIGIIVFLVGDPFATDCYWEWVNPTAGGFKYFLLSSLLGEMIQFD